MKKGNYIGFLLCMLPMMLFGKGFHDPTRPSFLGKESESGFSDFVLQGIYQSRDKNLALVNGEYYGQGDRVGINQIISIGKEKVIIKHQGKAMTVSLFPVVKEEINK